MNARDDDASDDSPAAPPPAPAAAEWRVPLNDLLYGEEEERAVVEVIRSRWLTMGPRVIEFERRIADLCGARHGIALSSCTAGLHLVLEALGIGPGDEVLVPSLTFVATVNVVVNVGATPVFCDVVSPELPLIDPAEIARNLGPATRAVIAMDYAGYPCDYDAIQTALADHDASLPPFPEGGTRVHLIEDAAHGIGGNLDEMRALGACGDAGVFSFFSNKNLATGEGGMVVTDRADIAERVRLLRQHGLTNNTWERHQDGRIGYDAVAAGWNYRPTEITAALGLAQVSKIETIRERRQAVVCRYHARLAEIPEVVVPFAHVKTWHRPALHVFPVLLPDHSTRMRVREFLNARGVQTSFHYPPVHTFDFYRRHVPTAAVSLPRTESFADREVTLPLHPGMTDADVDMVVDAIKESLTR